MTSEGMRMSSQRLGSLQLEEVPEYSHHARSNSQTSTSGRGLPGSESMPRQNSLQHQHSNGTKSKRRPDQIKTSPSKPPVGRPPTGHQRSSSNLSLSHLGISSDDKAGGADQSLSPTPHMNGHRHSRSFIELSPNETRSARKGSFDESPRSRRSEDGRPTWEEKGKAIAYQDGRPKSAHQLGRPKRVSTSQPSSRASSPTRSLRNGASSSRGGSPLRKSAPTPLLSATSPPQKATPEQVSAVVEMLADRSSDIQIRALKKLRNAAELCRGLVEHERGVAVLVKLVERPASRAWLPFSGCTDVQANAVAVVSRMLALSPEARSKIVACKGLPAIVEILKSGSGEPRSHAAKAIACLAQDPSHSFQIGQAGGCAPLIAMLPSLTAIHSSYVSLQMAVDHEEAQADAANALASLASSAANQQKLVEGGAINSLVLCLSHGHALQTSAARCLHKLGLDPEYLELILQAGAMNALLKILASEEAHPDALAAAMEAVGGIINNDRMAAETVPHLVNMLTSDSQRVTLAASRALADLASRNRFSRTKIAEQDGCVHALMDQLRAAESQLAMTAKLEARCTRSSPLPFVSRIKDTMGEQGLRLLHRLVLQMGVSLTNATDGPSLVKTLRENAWEHQRATVRLLHCLSLKGYSQTKVLQAGEEGVKKIARLVKSEVVAIRSKAVSTLSCLATVRPGLVRAHLDGWALVVALQGAETKLPALRLLLNLTTEESSLNWLVDCGAVPTVLEDLQKTSADVQYLAASSLANMTTNPRCRELIVERGLELLVKVLEGESEKAMGPAAQTLWQLIEDSGDGKLSVAEAIGSLGAPAAVVGGLQQDSPDIVEHCSALTASMAKSSHNAAVLADEGAIGLLILLLRSKSGSIQSHACEALRYIASVSDRTRHMIVGPSGASIAVLVKLLDSSEEGIPIRAANCLGALAASKELAMQLDEYNVTTALTHFLHDSDEMEEQRAAVRALAKIAVHSPQFSQVFEQLGGFQMCEEWARHISSEERSSVAASLRSLTATPRTPVRFEDVLEHEECNLDSHRSDEDAQSEE